MEKTKKLLIRVKARPGNDFSIVPVNTGEFVSVKAELGQFLISVFIKDFDGSKKHGQNSLFNTGDRVFLDGSNNNIDNQFKNLAAMPNLRILIKFTPEHDISGAKLLFGNDCETSVKAYVPVSLLATGLRFFSWFVNPNLKSDLYCDEPYIFGTALNSFSKISIASESPDNFISSEQEFLSANGIEVPPESLKRQKFFGDLSHCENFTFRSSESYYLMFDTNFLKLGNSLYQVLIPTMNSKTLDINVLRFANENLNNFNWTVKLSGDDMSVQQSALALNFMLVEED